MRKKENKYILVNNPDFMLVDAIAMTMSFSIAYLYKFKTLDFLSKHSFRIVVVSIVLINIIIALLANPYSGILKRGRVIELRKVIWFAVCNFVSLSIILFALKIGQNVSREVIATTYINFVILSFIFRNIWKRLKRNMLNDKTDKKGILIISYKENIVNIIHNIENSDIQDYHIAGLCLIDNDGSENINGYKVVCKLDDIYEYTRNNNVDEIFIAAKSNILKDEIVAKLLNENIAVNLSISHVYGLEPNGVKTNKVGIYDTFGFDSFSFSSSQYFYIGIKRIFDVVFSIIGLLLLGIAMLIIKIANLLFKDNGPLFYTQTRVGKNGRLFEIIKFRTMAINADDVLDDLLENRKYKEEWLKHQKIDNDPRITKVGKFLRKTSLDEIPQFINVLKGDMSLVGPRPLVPGELQMHGGIKLYEQVKPGMTSWWACNGRSNINYQERLEFEYFYIKNISLLLDISCVLKTIIVIIKRTGAK